MKLRLEVTNLQLGHFMPDPGPAPASDAGEEAWIAWLTATPIMSGGTIPAALMQRHWQRAINMGFPLASRGKLGDLVPETKTGIRFAKPTPIDRDLGAAAKVAVAEKIVFDGVCVVEIEAKEEDVALFGYILQEMILPFPAGSIKVLPPA